VQTSETHLIPTGIAIHIGDRDWPPSFCRARAGPQAWIVLVILVGLIDSDYQGQLFISLLESGRRSVHHSDRERIAQLVIVRCGAEFAIVERLRRQPAWQRRFRHSGRH